MYGFVQMEFKMELLKFKEKYFSLIEADDFDYNKFNQFAIVHHSNSIEGSTLTKEETYLLLEEHLTPKKQAFRTHFDGDLPSKSLAICSSISRRKKHH